MTVKELIEKLKCFDLEHDVSLEISAECGHLNCQCTDFDVQFRNDDCVLYGQTD